MTLSVDAQQLKQAEAREPAANSAILAALRRHINGSEFKSMRRRRRRWDGRQSGSRDKTLAAGPAQNKKLRSENLSGVAQLRRAAYGAERVFFWRGNEVTTKQFVELRSLPVLTSLEERGVLLSPYEMGSVC